MRNQASAENPTWNEITTIKRGERRKNLPSALAGMPFPLEPIPPGFASPGPCCENCKIRIPESEAGGLRAPGQPGLHSEILSQKKKQTKQNKQANKKAFRSGRKKCNRQGARAAADGP
jgi:hypothetical protein